MGLKLLLNLGLLQKGLEYGLFHGTGIRPKLSDVFKTIVFGIAAIRAFIHSGLGEVIREF